MIQNNSIHLENFWRYKLCITQLGLSYRLLKLPYLKCFKRPVHHCKCMIWFKNLSYHTEHYRTTLSIACAWSSLLSNLRKKRSNLKVWKQELRKYRETLGATWPKQDLNRITKSSKVNMYWGSWNFSILMISLKGELINNTYGENWIMRTKQNVCLLLLLLNFSMFNVCLRSTKM